MAALSGFVSRHARLVFLAALAITLAALPLATKQQDRLRAGDTIAANSQSATVTNAIAARSFPGAENAPLSVVLRPARGAGSRALSAAIRRVSGEVGQVAGVGVSAAGRRAALALAAARPQAFVILPLHYGSGVGIDQARELMRKLGIASASPGTSAHGRVTVYLVGEGALWASLIQTAYNATAAAEEHALPLTLLVLLAVFGSVAAALLPLAVGLVSLTVAGAIIYLLSLVTDMSIFASTIASMLGLAVAIDYSMFIVVRYREEIALGLPPEAARARTMATSGRAIAYSGLTVALSQAALFLIASPGVRSIGAGTIIVVAVSVLIAATMLPALIAVLGGRASDPGLLGQLLERRQRRIVRAGFWERWTAVVMRHPVVCLVSATALMLAIASPTIGLTVRNSATNQLPATSQVRVGSQLVAKAHGIGALAPVQVVVSGTPGHRLKPSTVSRVAAAIARDPQVARLARTNMPVGADRALITALLKVDPESTNARNTIDRLRHNLTRAANATSVNVGGTTAIILDFDRLLSAQMWRPILFVLTVSFVVLFVLLRSVVLPLKAVAMNLLSVLASYGALVMAFKWGWLTFLGIPKSPTLYPTTLPLVLTICSGLSMDYHIFLLSRIQERYLMGSDTRTAVGQGLASSATAITSAALIMVIVFLAFVFDGTPSSEQVGFAAAVAIALDATVVRLIIVPAAMELLGSWNWWLPRPLDRILPAGLSAHAGAGAEKRAGAVA